MMAPGATAPRVVNHDHIVRMKPGSAIVDMTQIRAKQEAPSPVHIRLTASSTRQDPTTQPKYRGDQGHPERTRKPRLTWRRQTHFSESGSVQNGPFSPQNEHQPAPIIDWHNRLTDL
ncbi:hypothetical protein [Aeromonas salmonicida]|uniref:hypothetical protein n=1 Tax=Aeromonas salmonicida TaxID=645 RepID=UPI000F7BA87F